MAAERIKVLKRHLGGAENYTLKNTSASQLSAASGNEFQYTLDNSLLSYDQRKFYEDNGYLLIKGLVDHQLLDECRQRFIDLCEGKVPKGGMTLMKDISLAKTGATGEYLYNKAQDILWDDVFSKYIVYPRILDYVECFVGPNVKAIHTMLINKPPDSGKMTSVHPLHQDLHYFPFRPADRIVAAWTAMEKIHVDNGCLIVLPGSHKGKLEQHDYPELENGVNKAYHGVKGYHDEPAVPLEMEKGDTVFFHPILIHGSGVNVTKGFRKAISSHYASSNCYFIDIKGTTQENIAKEVEEISRKKGLSLTFEDVWRYRSRLVRGVEGTLS